MRTREDDELYAMAARPFGNPTPAKDVPRVFCLDWIMALGRTSLDSGDLRTAHKYFNMAHGLDRGNAVACRYLDLTRRMILRKREGDGGARD